MVENDHEFILAGGTGAGKSTLINYLTMSDRFVDTDVISTNRHDVAITWLDSTMDSNDQRTQSLLNQLNDQVNLYNNARDCINYLYECRETTLFIVSGKCAEEYLRSVHSLSSIDSIIIYCAATEKHSHLINENYSKILACVSSEGELIECVHKWIDLKCQTHFYTWNHQIDYIQSLTRPMSLFLANSLLANAIEYQAYGKRKDDMVKISQAYYAQHPLEFNHIQEFELTYIPDDAINWYTRNSFVHKIVNRALRSFDNAKLRAIAFYIRDLRLQLRKERSKTDPKKITKVYHGLAMTQADVRRLQSTPMSSFISMNGFLSTSQNREIALAFAKKKQNTLSQPLSNVLLEINIDVENSPIIFADIAHRSFFPEEAEVLFDLGAMFCLQDVIYEKEDDIQLYTIKLALATKADYDSIQQSLQMVKYRFEKQTNNSEETSLIGKLLNVKNPLDEQPKKPVDYGSMFSLLRIAFNTLWEVKYDEYKGNIDGTISSVAKFCQFFRKKCHRTEKLENSTKHDIIEYDEILLARFEPVLVFHLDNAVMQDERLNLSTVFQSQYRRFITKHWTLAQMDENLDEYYYIYYISSELPEFMKENRRIKFYQFQLPFKDQNTDLVKLKIMERLRSQLLHDLGMFYAEQAKNASIQNEDQSIIRALKKKGAKCFELIAEEAEKIIQRYRDI